MGVRCKVFCFSVITASKRYGVHASYYSKLFCFIVDLNGCGHFSSLVVMVSIWHSNPLTTQAWSSRRHKTLSSCLGIPQSARQLLWGCSSCEGWKLGNGHFHQPASQHRSDRSHRTSMQHTCGPLWQSLRRRPSTPALPHQSSAFQAGPANRNDLDE